jgi:predicted metal-dependent peptidase
MLMLQPLTLEQRVQKATIDVMAKDRYAALNGIIMIGSKRIERDPAKCPTAYTNGKDVIFGAEFIDGMKDAELRFLLLHEEYHKLYRHLTTWRWMFLENPQLANMACDFVINCKLRDDNTDGFATMTGKLEIGGYDPKYRGWDAAQVFHDLKKNPPSGGGKGRGQGQGFDEHGWDEAEAMTEEEKTELAREIDEAIRQGALMAGKMGSGGNRDFDDLLQPQVDWREALREFIKTTCTGKDYSTWKRPNRRYIGAGIYMPSGITESVGEIAILIDTSGSTYAPGVLPAFMSEAKAVCDLVKPERVHIIYWDTTVCQAEVYEQADLDKMIGSTQPKGGGGTHVPCAIDYMAKNNIRPQAAVVLTDGHLGGVWGSWSCPVLWCVIDNKSATAPVGTTVHIQTHNM